MQKPARLHPWADEILANLAGRPGAGEIVLGGYFALQHYLDYRTTHDIDAWWRKRADPTTERAIRTAMEQVAASRGCVLRERRFGETLSFELEQSGETRFSFQIAVRTIELEAPEPSPWPPVLIETLRDNVGAKMNALVDRGAPRDFMDIRAIVEADLADADECWRLWSRKNVDADIEPAKQKVHLHLTAIESRRPLDSIADHEQRVRAEQTRHWFREEFLR